MSQAQPASVLDLLRDTEARRQLLGDHSRLDRDLLTNMAEAVAQEGRVDPKRMAMLATAFQEVAESAGNPLASALARRLQGNVQFVQGNFAAAVAAYREAIMLFVQVGEEIEIGRTLGSMLHPLAMLGQPDESLEAAERARRIFERKGEKARLGRLEINCASVLFRVDRLVDALDSLDRAAALLADTQDREAMAAILISRAVVLISLARFTEAEECYGKARDYALRHHMPMLVAQADYNIGYLYFLRGQYVKAMRMLDRARETAARHQDKLHLALCDLDQADVCIELNLFEDALQLAQSALEQFQNLSMPYEEGKALTNMAVAEQHLGHDTNAIELLDRASQRFTSAGNDFWVRMVQLYRAVALLKMGRCFEALQLGERARAFFAEQKARTKEIYAAIVVAKARAAANQLDLAQQVAQEAAAALENFEAPWLRFQAHALLGHLAETRGQLTEALAAYNAAMDQSEATRGNINFDELRVSFMRDKALIYERYLAVLQQMYPEPPCEAIWQHMERAKSRSLAMVMSRGFGSIQPRMAEGSRVVQEINRLREELNWYYRQLDPQQAGSTGVEKVVEAIRERENDLLRAIRQLPDAEYRLLEQDRSISLPTVLSHLPETTLIEYYACGDHFAAIVADEQGIHFVPQAGRRATVESALRLLRFQVGKRAMETNHFQRFAEAFARATDSHLEILYQELMAPLEPWLRHRQLMIVPHGILHALPFHALRHDGRNMVDDHVISVSPSAAVFVLSCEHPESAASGNLLVAAQPQFAVEEVRAVAQALENPTVLEREASALAKVRAHAERSRIIHMATHGLFRADNPYFSALELSDGRLNVIDIYNLHLDAELVVLSGCGTALGDLSGGDEVIGLTRAFLYAGARRVIGSLWDVDDVTTAGFMKSFYRHMAEKVPYAHALRNAILETRAAQPHPFFWAPFMLTGKPY